MTRMLPDLAYAGGYLVEGVGASGVCANCVGPQVAGVLKVGLVGGNFAPTCAYLDYIIDYKCSLVCVVLTIAASTKALCTGSQG